MKKLGITLLLYLAIAFNSNGQNSFVLEGTIGKYPVIMQMNSFNGNWSAVYFYKKFRHDIELEGQISGADTINLRKDIYESKSGKEILSEMFTLHRVSNSNIFTGIWKNRKGVTLPVNLKPIDSTKYDFSVLPDITVSDREEDLFTKVRLSELTIIKDSVTQYEKYSMQWIHETGTGIQSFILLNGFEKEQLKKINEEVRKKFYLRINSNYSCIGRHEDDGDYDSNFSNYFISPEFFSVEVHDSWYCGGAHPGFADNSFTISAKTGKEVKDLDELFWFTGKKPVNEKDEKYYDYIDERAKSIVAILTQLYPVEMSVPVDKEKQCDYTHFSDWDFPSWYFTKKGLYLGAVFPNALGACNDPDFSYIPYSLLKKYLSKEITVTLPDF